jgi:signal transduction histidine kinase
MTQQQRTITTPQESRMLNSFVESFLRSRLGLPVTLVLAAAMLLVSELSYNSAVESLDRAVRLGQARLDLLLLRQQITDAETGQRGYIITGNPAFLDPYKDGVAQAGATAARLADVVRTQQPALVPLLDEITKITELKLSELATTVRLRAEGKLESAIEIVNAGIGKSQMDRMRQLSQQMLEAQNAAVVAQRRQIYSALLVSRLGVGLLTVLAALGVIVYIRQSVQLDGIREEQRRELQHERDRLEQQVALRTQDLRELATHLQTTREDERGHLARELHDELGGLLTAAKLDVARMRSKLQDKPELIQRLDHLATSLNDGIALKRRIIEDLRPSSLTHLGLVPALQILCREMEQRLGVPVQPRLDAIGLQPPADLAVYRFVQEALTNVGKYANAKRVSVLLRQDRDGVQIEVEDDGIGFDTNASQVGHHGHSGQRFRVESLGGQMWIDSRAGRGTRLRATLPASTVAA